MTVMLVGLMLFGGCFGTAVRPKGFGMTADLAEKKATKYDVDMEIEVRDWMERVLDKSIGNADSVGLKPGADKLHAELKDGTILCELINAIRPNSVRTISKSKKPFKMMENIGKFLDACMKFMGMLQVDMFQPMDLYEMQNMSQVVNGIFALARKANGFGPKEHHTNDRVFTDEQLRAREAVIGRQNGSNKGASQAGQNFGKK